MSKYYRYTETALNVPDSFHKSILVGRKNITIEFVWPSYIEEEIHNINLAAYSRMTSMGLDDGTQVYDYYDYWEDVSIYLNTHTVSQWIADTTKVKPVILLNLPSGDQEAWVAEQLDFFIGCLEMLDFYYELLVWEMRIQYGGYTLSVAGNLGGWTEFPDGTFAFKFASANKEHIGRNDLPYMNIYFEVYDE